MLDWKVWKDCRIGLVLSSIPVFRQCATSREVSGSIPGIAGDFSVASDSFMCLGVDSACKNEYQDNPGNNGGRCVRLTTYHIHVPFSRNLGP